MELSHIRKRIDEVDDQLLKLFCERMDLAAAVADSKRQSGRAVFDPAREREKLTRALAGAPKHLSPYVTSLFSLLMSMSRAEQQRILCTGTDEAPSQRVRSSILPIDAPFPAAASVACQGVEGAYSQIAASKLFHVPDITYFTNFEGVFRAVASNFCDYGVLPIENSTAGSVNQVYDLMGRYRCFIVRSLRLKVDHQLLALPGATLKDLHTVYSHEQAIAQCAGFLDELGVKVEVVENTARAAEMVAQLADTGIAALSSASCAALYGLHALASNVQDTDNNYTRFVVISSKPQVFPGSTRTSLMLTLPHETGALYRVLERFFALDINLVKLESRPIAGRNFEFMFYFDLDCPAGSAALDTLLDSLDDVCEHYTYFGTYTEVL